MNGIKELNSNSNFKHLTSNSAITLIALIITIIVLLILAGITLNMVIGKNGIFSKANTASEQTKIANAKEIIKTAVLENEVYKNTGDENGKSDKQLQEEIKKKLENEGYTVNDDDIIKIGEKEINIKVEIANVSTGDSGETIDGKEDKSKNRTLAGTTEGYSYKNPVIPQGFKAVDVGTAIWNYKDSKKTEVVGWNDGLVIQDEIGNQFVWVPVDGVNVNYAKWCTIGYNNQVKYSTCNDDLSAIPVNENAQINTYQGFYVARYEAGLTTETTKQSSSTNNNTNTIAVSKEGAKIWNYISYNNANIVAKAMINNRETYGNNKSGLITGTQWDTIMKWYQNEEIKVDKTQDWGTYSNLAYNGNGKYYRYTSAGADSTWKEGKFIKNESSSSPWYYHASGLNLNGIKKNVADLGGNVREWTAEVYSDKRVGRSGVAHDSSKNYPVSYRHPDGANDVYSHIGFRTVLYIQSN